MAEHVDWGDIDPGNKKSGNRKSSGGSGIFMKLEPNSDNVVRPLGKPVAFYKYFHRHEDGSFRSAITSDPDRCTVKQTHPELTGSQRYAILVFDRNDDNKLKVLEGPKTIFKFFKEFYRITKKEPGGKEGADFRISVNCPNGRKDRDTTYDVEVLDHIPFTEDEKNFYRENKDNYDIKKIFASEEPEVIERKLFGSKEENQAAYRAASGDNSEGSYQSSQGQKETASVSTSKVASDDDFNF